MLSPLPTHSTGRLVRLLGFSLVAVVALFALAARADAAETLYWDNYESGEISEANIDGTGGGALNLGGVEVENPEGMAIDSSTGRLIVASSGEGASDPGGLVAVDLDGSGASMLATPGVRVEHPEGVAIDPANGTVYWINEGENAGEEAVDWARLDGSAAGQLNTAGATLAQAYRIAVDPSGGRVYWGNTQGTASISYANLDNSGGGNLNITGTTPGDDVSGIAVDPAGGRVYWVNESERISYASLNGSGGGDLSTEGAYFNQAYGLVFDPSVGRFLWANYGNGSDREGAIGFGNLNGGGGEIEIASAPVEGPQDPVVLKSPSGNGAPQVSRDATNPASLSCSNGSWVDYPGSSVFQAPHTYAYQWTENGAALAGATASTLAAPSPGSYACTVTGTNQLGSASQGSAAVSVTAAKLKLTTKKKANAKPGKAATFKVKALNQGDLATGTGTKLCVKVPKKAKSIKAPKCKPLGALTGLATKSVTLKLKVAKKAKPGTYKVSIAAKGAPANTVKAKLVVKKQQ